MIPNNTVKIRIPNNDLQVRHFSILYIVCKQNSEPATVRICFGMRESSMCCSEQRTAYFSKNAV